jgi:maltose alpha-D-glucosyltransferase/alpha-amylase
VIDNDPLWFKDAVIYQVHVKAFFDSNDDGIGDFPGLMAKLDYVKNLGATCIWLLPFFPSPMRDDGYDIADYRNINPAFGTMHDFRAFVKAAHERGIRVLIELVVNHTSDQHAWFQRARRSKKGSLWRDFYVWSDSDKKYAGTRIIFTDTETSNWTWDPVAGEYYWHRFFSHQPDLNYANPRVIEAIMNVMRYWLDTGVDGLRLDAVPYLCEREGTSNENLPETHGVIKIMRAVLDHEYKDRIFLAEANQWPEDVRQYFGDGDECHMAFHFPLMPRMFMAIAEEDRYPIIDIMRQTPEIPDNCQWAIFLRNHDEMTLEMVTERERDSMYRIYATEPRARINVGIRRRLAPLMENDRRKIELLLGLLLSMPGTPIVYYGDELGMGDNIYLSDRDGVRTPMQWSIDRNGGFSRADPARLYLPPIMDPVYGFASVNVESQSRSPSSLINWLRKLIAVRQGYKVFGRGTLTFIKPTNRKVIAYVREHGDEKVLCVANLAHTAQQVVLDLSPYRGRVPVEMSGWSPFHAIAADRYAVSLPGYGFYWFLLAETAKAPKWTAELPGQLPELATLVLPRDDAGATQLGGTALELFEAEVLPAFLPKQRWYSDKNAATADFHLLDTGRLEHDGVRAYLSMIEGIHRYFLPVVIGGEFSTEQTNDLSQAVLARTRTGAHSGVVLDAFALDEFARALLEDVRNNREIPGVRGGKYLARGTSKLDAVTFAGTPAVRRMDVEQSNSSVVVGESVILKGYRRIDPGPQPELEVARFLDAVGYRNTPALYGSLEYVDPSGVPTALAIAMEFVECQGDGWTAALAYLERFFDRRKNMASAPASDTNDASREHDYHQIFVERARTLGIRTAEVHRAFAISNGDPAFEPEPVTQDDLEAWVAGARASAETALVALAREMERVPKDLRKFAQRLLETREELEARLTLPPVRDLGRLVKTRFHGDYHLGQVLVVADDFKLIDFEGEPGRTLPERRRKALPLRDVAGMLRSINYAAVAALRGATHDRAEDTSALEPLARDWERRCIEAFLAGYREAIAGCPSYPQDPAQAQRLLDLLILEKAFYEMSYELANRPAWVRIPLEGIRSILHAQDSVPALA